mgnify:CR=1 FL=1
MQWWMWLVAGAVGVLALHLALVWMERRGWVYYLHPPKRGSGGGVGAGIAGELMNAFQPTREVIVAEREWQKVRVQQAENGDGPNTAPDAAPADGVADPTE